MPAAEAAVEIGATGLQVQTVISRWRDYGVLQALGFTHGQILAYYGLQFVLVLTGGVTIAAFVSLLLPSWSAVSLITAASLAGAAAGIAAMPVLLWPLWRPPAELLRDTA